MSDQYRKLPVVIQAWQNLDDNGYPDWLARSELGREAGGVIVIPTLEGVMRASMGDYIIRGVKGELYPCKADIFEATYEKLPEIGAAEPLVLSCKSEFNGLNSGFKNRL